MFIRTSVAFVAQTPSRQAFGEVGLISVSSIVALPELAISRTAELHLGGPPRMIESLIVTFFAVMVTKP